jgi:hypothetical protein
MCRPRAVTTTLAPASAIIPYLTFASTVMAPAPQKLDLSLSIRLVGELYADANNADLAQNGTIFIFYNTIVSFVEAHVTKFPWKAN